MEDWKPWKGDSFSFYWEALYDERGYNTGVPELRPTGKRLFARFKEDSMDYERVIDVKGELFNPSSCRLYACRDFGVGDAITFLSEYEEKYGSSVLGAIHARIVDKSESNAYLTTNRTLRALRRIKKGEEITRSKDTESIAYMDRIDRVVLSLDDMIVGRIGVERIMGSGCLVHFTDNKVIPGRHRHLLVANVRLIRDDN
eukprot:CAMPEP_0113623630 /NCGR_PEP_ID=MMETSP0017_2-20120614/12160_1 /TAXON_ID=2856 /ORGANISM="Cylindrotheca closterium" /LENGTH=199 /DNA_ID=CAMNT_0000533593 /DNA_START=139 /DNA_END=738 /DNA_ORIENTATION=- /assembly_acc=CAM_ASM_000147